MNTNSKLNISVVIPAHEGWSVLKPTLESLAGQTLKPDEIIVVLDRTIDWGEVPAEFRDFNPPLRPVSAISWLGPMGCRNIGIESASGEIVVFLDSSVIASTGLIEAHRESYCNEEVIGVAGRIEFFSGQHRNDWFYEYSPFTFCFSQSLTETEVIWGPTANVSYRRSAAPEVKFLEIFPVRGACEDVCFGYSLAPFGKKVHNPRAVVQHEYWYPLLFVLRKFARWGRGEAILCHYSLKNRGFAEVIRRQLEDLQLLVLALLAVAFTVIAEIPGLRWSILLIASIHITKNVLSSLFQRGFRNWQGQLAGWVQNQCYLSGVLFQSIRMMDIRPLFMSVRLFPAGMLPRRKWTIRRSLLSGIYLTIILVNGLWI